MTQVYVETSGSALNRGTDALRALGMLAHQAHRTSAIFRRNNDKSIAALAKAHHEFDEATYVNQARGWLEQFEKILSQDLGSLGGRDAAEHRAWAPTKQEV